MLLEDLQVVLKVAEFHSITGAATSLDMRVSTASAALKRVESTLGVELFVRTTRKLRLSPAGERYIPQCEQALLVLKQAQQNIKEELGIIDGELRIALSSDLGRNLVIPWLDEFTAAHPQVSLRTNISDSNLNFYRDAVDMALRYGSPDDAGVYGFKICNVPRLLCAAPSYLEQHGTPKHPDELNLHNGLFYQLYGITHDIWEFAADDQHYKIRMKGNRSANDGDLVRRWCVAGQGITIKSCLDMSTDLVTGSVINVLPEFKATPTELWLIFPSRQSITPVARLLRDTLKEKCSITLKQLVDQGILPDDVLEDT